VKSSLTVISTPNLVRANASAALTYIYRPGSRRKIVARLSNLHGRVLLIGIMADMQVADVRKLIHYFVSFGFLTTPGLAAPQAGWHHAAAAAEPPAQVLRSRLQLLGAIVTRVVTWL